MGNKPVRIGLEVDRTRYRAGDVMTGKVYLAVSSTHFLGRQQQEVLRNCCRGVQLILEGDEHVEIEIPSDDDDHQVDGRRFKCRDDSQHGSSTAERCTHTLVRTDFPLVAWENIDGTTSAGLTPGGQYEYPFEWRLPSNIPGSMRCQSPHSINGRSFAEIRYSLTAYIATAEMGRNSGVLNEIQKERASKSLHITAFPTPPEQSQPIVMEMENFPVTSCCLWNKGVIQLGWQLDGDQGSPNYPVEVHLTGGNQSLLEVECIRVQWIESVRWHTDNRNGTKRHSIHQKRDKRVLAEQRVSVQNLPGWKPFLSPNNNNDSGRGKANHRYRTVSSSSSNNQQEQEEEEVEVHTVSARMILPSDARDSYTGRYVDVRHMLVVSAETAGGCTTTSPEVTSQVRVVQRRGGQQRATIGGAAAALAESTTPPALVSTTTPSSPSAGAGTVQPSAPSEMEIFHHDNNNNNSITSWHDGPPSGHQLQQHAQQQHPLAQAEILPADWQPSTANVVTLPEAAAVLMDEGLAGTAAAMAPAVQREASCAARDGSAISGCGSSNTGPSLEQLERLVAESPENLSALLQDAAWAAFVQNLSPRGFSAVVSAAATSSRVASTRRRIGGTSSCGGAPFVADTLARVMGSSFECRHILACLWTLPVDNNDDNDGGGRRRGSGGSSNGAAWHVKMEVLRRTAPLASDMAVNQSQLERELDANEILHLRAALKE